MALVRAFVTETPTGRGLLLAGREHFFDDQKEVRSALHLRAEAVRCYLNVFDESQVREYVKGRTGVDCVIPAWLPRRPLLLSYLAARKVFDEGGLANTTPAEGWLYIFEKVGAREAAPYKAIDGDAVCAIVRQVASSARKHEDGRGPVYMHDLIETFQHVCMAPPDEMGMQLLQRLPGLGVLEAGTAVKPVASDHNARSPVESDGARYFVDPDFAVTAQALDVFQFILAPRAYLPPACLNWRHSLSQLGHEIIASECRRESIAPKDVVHAMKCADERGASVMCFDLLMVLAELDASPSFSVSIRDVDVPLLDCGSLPDWSRVEFVSCVIREIELPPYADSSTLPKFKDCMILKAHGRAGEKDLPSGIFQNCSIDLFSDSVATNASILASTTLSLGMRVALTMLRKLYLQPGNGRKVNALYRGLDNKERAVAVELVGLLKRHGLATETRIGGTTILLPVMNMRAEVLGLLERPTISASAFLTEANGV